MKYIATTIAASIFSFNVMAADSSHCNSLDKGPQFNKTVLSEFDKCWLNTHRSDKKSGVDGNVFWIKIDGKFISMPIKDLFANGNNKETVKKVIKEKVFDTTIVDALKLEIGIKDAQIAGLQSDLATKIAELSTLKNAITSTEYGATLTEISSLATVINTIETERTDLSNGLSSIVTAINERTSLGFASGIEGTIQRVNDLIGTLNTRQQELNDIYNKMNNANNRARIISRMNTLANLFLSTNNGGMHDHYAFTTTKASPIDNRVQAHPDTGQLQITRDGGAVYTPFGSAVAGVYFDDITYHELNVAIDEAYNQGYSDGYDAGYAAGYADGFSDGVASVGGLDTTG